MKNKIVLTPEESANLEKLIHELSKMIRDYQKAKERVKKIQSKKKNKTQE